MWEVSSFLNLFLASSSLATVNNNSSSVQLNKTIPTSTNLMKSIDK